MTGYYLAGAWLILVAAVICFFAGRSRLERIAREDATYDALRGPLMGDIASEPTPLFDQLAAERVLASAAEAVEDAWKGGAA